MHIGICFRTAGVKDPRLYSCPIYKKPVRTDLNYIAAVDLKTSLPPEFWILRGVALLCDVKWMFHVKKKQAQIRWEVGRVHHIINHAQFPWEDALMAILLGGNNLEAPIEKVD